MTSKPLWLLDIDGVLSPRTSDPPEGFVALGDGWDAWYRPSDIEAVLRLSAVLDLWWASTWEDDANFVYAPVVGLPALPFVAFEEPASLNRTTEKLADVQRAVGDRPLVWTDDVFEDDARKWAARRDLRIPTLLVPVNPRVGLTATELAIVEAFAESASARNDQESLAPWDRT